MLPLTLRPGLLAHRGRPSDALRGDHDRGHERLEIEAGELQAEYRPALTQGGQDGLEAEIYVYDTLAGGAGFARRVGDLGRAVFEDTIHLLEGCPEGATAPATGACAASRTASSTCLLDRHLGASLLRYLVRGEEPTLDRRRIEQAVDRLQADLSRQGLDGLEFLLGETIELPGLGDARRSDPRARGRAADDHRGPRSAHTGPSKR